MIGTPAETAVKNAPRLNESKPLPLLLVPSGKIHMEVFFSVMAFVAFSIDARDFFLFFLSIKIYTKR